MILAAIAVLVQGWVPAAPPTEQTPVRRVLVDRDDVQITESCTIEIPGGLVIADVNGDGVIQVAAEHVVIDFAPGSVLRGAPEAAPDDELSGTGIRISGHQGVTIRGAHIEGFKSGVHASGADRLRLDSPRITRNFRQRLASTPMAENPADWLWPHDNDDNQWLTRYGAAIYLEDSREVEVRAAHVRRSQNGIVLDRVDDSRVYDSDCSFLSGWGLAMWRSSRNYISRNALDFCIRGYSHGVYNRGQDSAGILCFEQSSFNRFYENSATHSGDGFFGFAGKEALGDKSPPDSAFDYVGRGCNNNTLMGNDFSFASAHGVELTFSFNNTIRGNRLIGNAICGVWGGYSQSTTLVDNTIEDNGLPGAREGGGINIEHGYRNIIFGNRFARNTVAISLWSDDDGPLLQSPWAKANHRGSDQTQVSDNEFTDEPEFLRLRESGVTFVGRNRITGGPDQPSVDGTSKVEPVTDQHPAPIAAPVIEPLGDQRPIGARPALAGREHIVMGPWGPWDHASPMFRLAQATSGRQVYEIYGEPGPVDVQVKQGGPGGGDLVVDLGDHVPDQPRTISLRPRPGIQVVPYLVDVRAGPIAEQLSGVLVQTTWSATVFSFTADPRTDLDAWRAEARAVGATVPCDDLSWMRSLSRGVDRLPLFKDVLGQRQIGRSRYGVIATTRLTLPPGEWTFSTVSDDGVRLRINDTTVIENWTHHAPTRDTGTLTLQEPLAADITLEYFQLDGHATLEFEMDCKALNTDAKP